MSKLLKGERLRQYRKKKGLTLVELGKKLGISHASLSDIEKGKSSPSAETMASLLRETDININWFLAGAGEMMLTPVAPALEVIWRIIKALFAKELKADSKKGFSPTLIVSRYIDRVEKELGLMPGVLSLSYVCDPQADLPHESIVRFCMRRGISLDWVYTGEGEMIRSQRPKPLPVDIEIMKEVIHAVEVTLKDEHIDLSPKKKAVLIAYLSDELIEEPEKKGIRLKEKIIKFIKLQR